MSLVAAKCTQCGANIEVDNKNDAAICPCCNTAFIVEKAINNYVTQNITVNIGTAKKDFSIVAGELKKYRGESPTVIIPDNVSIIGAEAFSQMNITSVVIPASVVRIDNNAFEYCEMLTTVTLNSGLKEIGEEAFCRCSMLTEINIPASVTKIEKSAFIGCFNLKSVDIGAGVSEIADKAFSGCRSIAEIKIPGNVKKIGSAAFEYCTSLQKLTLCEGVETIENNAFSKSEITEITIPKSLKSAVNAFAGCDNLEKARFADGIKSACPCVFKHCTNLYEIIFPSTIEEIGEEAFSSCPSLGEITLPETIKKIDRYAFFASGIRKLTIKGADISIGHMAFEQCTRLNLVLVPKQLKRTLKHAFGSAKVKPYVE